MLQRHTKRERNYREWNSHTNYLSKISPFYHSPQKSPLCFAKERIPSLCPSSGGTIFYKQIVSDQSKLRKEFFSLWKDSTSSSKAILFLVFQTVQKMQRGPALQTILCFFPTKEPVQPNRVSLTDENTQDTPKRVKSISYNAHLFTMKKEVVNGFLFHLTKVTSIC